MSSPEEGMIAELKRVFGLQEDAEKALTRLFPFWLKMMPTLTSNNIMSALQQVPSLADKSNAVVMSIANEVKEKIIVLGVLSRAEGIFERAKLGKKFLEEEGFTDYIRAAEEGKKLALPVLHFLLGLQQEYSLESKRPNIFASILASSGTGKTQLAATASLTYNNKTEEVKTIYILCSQGNQRFYVPHHEISDILMEAIGSFRRDYLKLRQGKAATAVKIKDWTTDQDEGTCLFVLLLYRLLVVKEDTETGSYKVKIKLSELRALLMDPNRNQKYLVFLDEVPPKGSLGFDETLCLRDTLRYLGIAPILMSTHTGAQDYVKVASRSSPTTWMYTISKLPRYAPFPKPKPKAIFSPFERPLVLNLAMVNEENTLLETVNEIRKKLQGAKPDAWTTSTALQLVQLFCTDNVINKGALTIAHNLVGHHFGHLHQATREGAVCGETPYSSAAAGNFDNTMSVGPVSAQTEPLLYLALVTWDETMLKKDSDVMFPLVSKTGDPLTVRGAFEECSGVFKARTNAGNLEATKADGDLMEALVHASLTLASMKVCTKNINNVQYLPGMQLDEYIPLVQTLMVKSAFDELPTRPALFDSITFDWPLVPALGGSNSMLPTTIACGTESCLGFLKRPADKAGVDGEISRMLVDEKGEVTSDLEAPFISIECKNYTTGVDAKLMREIFERIKPTIKCSLIFVSSLDGDLFAKSQLTDLKKCFAHHPENESTSVVIWRASDEDPQFLKVGGEAFKAAGETKLLVVIFLVGLISANNSQTWAVGSQKRKRNNANYASDYISGEGEESDAAM